MIDRAFVKEVRSRLDGTQFAVCVVAWFVGGWQLVLSALAIMVVWGWIMYAVSAQIEKVRQRRADLQDNWPASSDRPTGRG